MCLEKSFSMLNIARGAIRCHILSYLLRNDMVHEDTRLLVRAAGAKHSAELAKSLLRCTLMQDFCRNFSSKWGARVEGMHGLGWPAQNFMYSLIGRGCSIRTSNVLG